MLKKLLKATAVLVALVSSDPLFGQAGDYTFSVSTSTYTPLGSSATLVSALEADGGEDTVGIGFDFEFEGVMYDTVAATSDGFLSFVTGATSTAGNDLDNGSGARRPLIAPLWDDMDGRANTSAAAYEVSGTAPNRVFTFEWRDWEWSWNSTDSVVSFQVKLYETSNVVEFHYRWECSSCIIGPDASIGLSGASTFLSVTGVGTGTPTASNSLEDSNIDTVVSNEVYTFTPPTCTTPTYTGASSVTASTITIDWTHATATNFEVNWDIAGFTQGAAGSTTASVNATSYTATSLNTGQAYDFYIRTDCGAGVYSNWSGPYTVTTVYVPPYLEDWANGYPNDWTEAAGLIGNPTVFSSTTASSWAADGFANNGSTGAAKVNIYGSGIDEWLISPSIDLGTGSLIYQLEFDAGLTPWNGTSTASLGSDDTVKLVISTDNGLTWSNANTLLDLDNSSTILNGSGTHYIVNLAGYTGVVKFAFYAESTSSNVDNDFFIDNVEVVEVPACPEPQFLADSNITVNSIDLGWQSAGSGPWYIYWGPCGFDQASSGVTIDTVTTNQYVTMSGLPSNTSYQFYLFEDCGAQGLSDTVDFGCISTDCGPLSIPFAEGFNSNSLTEHCWTVLDSNNDGDMWDVNYSTNPFDGDEVAMMYTDFNSGNNNDWLISPPLSLSANERLKFQYRVQSSGEPNDFMLLVSTTGTSPADFADTLLPLASYSNTTYQEMVVNLSAYSGTTYLAWHIPSGGLDGWRLYIDAVLVETIPPCPSSTALMATAIGSDSIQISWTPGGSAQAHGVEYGPVGFTPGSGSFIATTDTFAIAQNLTPNTEYDFYVYDTCTSGFSMGVGPETFKTSCLPITIPYTETFNSTSTTQDCWAVLNANNDADAWNMNYTTNTHSGDQVAMMYTDFNGGANDDYLISPGLTLSADEELIYYYRVQSSGEPNDFQVLISQTGIAPADFTDTILPLASYSNTTYAEQKIDLSAYSGTCHIAWHVPPGGLDGWRIYIDSVVVQALPPCPDPTLLTATNLQPYQATLGWTQPNGTTWNIEWGPQGFIQATGTGNVINGVGNPYNLTGLGADSCYDYYVQQDCGLDGTSNWVGPFTFCTTPTCPAPTALGIDPGQLTINSADIYWTTGSAIDFNVEYGPAGFTRGSGTMINATNDTLGLTGLNPGTEYEFYVRDSCGQGDVSTWSGPVSFVTAFTTNYLQDFSSNPPFAWSEADGRLLTNTQFTATSSSWGNGNFGNVGANGAQKVNIYTSGQYEWMISPSIYLDPSITNLQVEFDAAITTWLNATQGYFGADDSLAIVISTDNGNSWSSSNIIWYNDANDTLDATGEHFIVPLTGYSGYVRFGIYAGSALDDTPDNDWFVDNFEVRTPRACASPSAITMSNITTDSASVDWTPGTTGFLGASVIYTVGNQPASAGTVVTGTTNPIILSGLSASTNYCVYVVEQCANGFSDTVGPVCFTTQCVPVSAPFFEDFENFTVGHFDGGESCWNFYSNNPGTSPSGNFSWEVRNSVQTTSGATGPDGDHTLYPAIGGKWIHSDNSGGTSNDSTMFMSPVVDITSLTNPQLEYWFHNYAPPTSNYRQPLYVDLFDGTTWYYKVHVIDSVYQSSGTDPWQDTIIDLAPYSSTGTIQVRFRSQITRSVGGAGDVAIDDVRIWSAGNCVAPAGIVATGGNCDSASVSWTSDAATTSSTLIYTSKGAGMGAGTVVGSATSPFVLSGLMMNTEYDVYIIDSCAAGFSGAVGPVTFKTDSVGPVHASFTAMQTSATLTDGMVDVDASASTGDGLTYDWDFGNSTSGTGSSTQGTYTANGAYSIVLTVTDRCGNTDDTTVVITVAEISIVENVFNADVEMYPNPNNGTFKVNVTEGSGAYAIEVIDLSGRVVYQQGNITPGTAHKVELQNKAKGVYMVRLKGDGLNVTQRIVID